MTIIFGLVMAAVKVILKAIMFTGLWISAVFLYLLIRIEPSLIKLFGEENIDLLATVYVIVFILLPPILYTSQNVIRIITKDPDYSMIKSIFGDKEKKGAKRLTNPSVPKDILSAEPTGVVFGKKQGRYVVKPENKDGHVLVIGGAGSGKSSCMAIPSLLSWQERVFAIDIKGELSANTIHQRPGAKVFNPSDLEAYGYDPFYLLLNSKNRVQDVREIALAIIPLSEAVKDPFWIKSAQNLLTGFLLYFFDQGLPFVEAITAIQGIPAKKLIQEIADSTTEEAKLFCNQFLSMKDETLSGIVTELSNGIILFATDPNIKRALSKKQIITPDDLEKGFDVYLTIEESKLEQWKNLLTLMVSQFLKHFERREEEGATPVLFLLDEFARLGKIEPVINGLATLRSKKVTIAIITQSLAQLDAIYGKPQRQVIADNCQYKAVLNATDADTQDYFSRLVGTYDKAKRSQSANFEQYTGMGKGQGISETTEEKRIIKPEEFSTLNYIVLLSPFGFFKVEKTPYYQEPIFKKIAI